MKSKNLYLFIFALLINCSQLKALTLSEAVTLALDSYPGLQANYQDVNAASARIDFAYSGYKPDIFIDARPQVVVRRHSSKSYPASASINFIQPLYRGGRTTAAILGATYEYHSQDFLYEEDVQRLILEIASLYVEILKEQAVLKANQNNLSYLEKALKTYQERFDFGDVTQTDLHQSKSRLIGAQASVTESENRISSLKAALEHFIGTNIDQMEMCPSFNGLPESSDKLLGQTLAQNKEYLAQKYLYCAAWQKYREIKGEKYPELYFNSYAQASKDDFWGGRNSNEAAAELNLVVPLYQAERVCAKLREAAAFAKKQYFLYQKLERELKKCCIQAWNDRATAKSQIEFYEAQIKTAKVALDGVTKEESTGLRTVVDVLDAELEVLLAEVNLIDSERDRFIAELEMLHLLGQLCCLVK
ncbi:MAG TPA: TolC family protein [Waddliaceae bacterium]